MLRAKAWNENCAFVDCPHCGALNELGIDYEYVAENAVHCDDCGQLFLIEEPSEETP